MIRVRTNGRAGIIGNPTDGYGGSVISCSIKNSAEVIIKEDRQLTVESRFGRRTLKWEKDFKNKGDYFDVVRGVLRFFNLYDLKARIIIDSNIPLQAGLAGSTAVLACVLTAVLTFTGKQYNRYKLAEINRIIELNYLKCQCGYQDAYMTTFGGLNYLDFRGKEYYKELDKEQYAVVEPLNNYVRKLPFVIAHTGIKHHSGNFHRPIRQRWLEEDKVVVEGYNEIMNIAREGKKALINEDWDYLAYLMNKNHEIQDNIAYSGEQNNYMIKVAKENGALAAKLAGAGGGGTIIALTFEPERTKNALKEAGAEKFIELEPEAKGVIVDYISEQYLFQKVVSNE